MLSKEDKLLMVLPWLIKKVIGKWCYINEGKRKIHTLWDRCVDAKCAPSAKHTASRTSWLHTCRESQDVPVNFPWKLTKDKVVKYQSLELAGWYQTVPYLRL
jgi:hypothetical protein